MTPTARDRATLAALAVLSVLVILAGLVQGLAAFHTWQMRGESPEYVCHPDAAPYVLAECADPTR